MVGVLRVGNRGNTFDREVKDELIKGVVSVKATEAVPVSVY
jgi:hypothetical protein